MASVKDQRGMAKTTRRMAAVPKKRRKIAASSAGQKARLLAGFPRASPADVGVSAAVLSKVRAGTHLEVRKLGSCSGAAHIVLRRGKCILAHADGWANHAQGVRFGLDTICRLHGSTKSLVAVAFMCLVEDGLVALDEPVSQYISFSDKVAHGSSVRPVKVKPTLRNLLTMTAGLKYTDCPAYAKVVSAVRRGKIRSLRAFCDALADVPLQFEPGSRHEYSFCTDFIGRICEVVSGENLEQFVRRRLLLPLGMSDTYFVVPTAKKCRRAILYECTPTKKRRATSMPYSMKRYSQPHSAPQIMSAGGGLLSYMDAGMWGTARDYARFCQMLLSGGLASDGCTRVLKSATIRALWHDSLMPFAGKDGRLSGWNVDDTEGPPWEGGSWDRCGFSPANALLQDLQGPLRGGSAARKGLAMGLGGGGGTYWYVDAVRQLVAITFAQCFGGGRPEDDGLGPPGNDCVELAIAAVDAGVKRRRTSCT